jgi:FtsH-binding integral membrane protein
MLFIVIFAAQIGLVLLITSLMNKISPAVMKTLFLVYSATVGLTVSIVLMVYPTGAVYKAFFSTAGIYAAMAIYGLVTKRSLQAWGSFLFMGLIGLMIAIVINFFTNSAALDYLICIVGVIVFAGLTAYDHQKLRVIHSSGFSDSSSESKQIILGALTLYLDFINLFLFLVRLFGRR